MPPDDPEAVQRVAWAAQAALQWAMPAVTRRLNPSHQCGCSVRNLYSWTKLKDHSMRAFLAVAIIAIMAGPAYGQSQVKGQTPGPPPPPPKSQQEIKAERDAEEAYKKSLGNIPDKPAADPWGNARSANTPQTTAKSPAGKKLPAKSGSTPN
jgi:hypothetical protein